MFPFFLSLFARLGARSVEAQRLVMARGRQRHRRARRLHRPAGRRDRGRARGRRARRGLPDAVPRRGDADERVALRLPRAAALLLAYAAARPARPAAASSRSASCSGSRRSPAPRRSCSPCSWWSRSSGGCATRRSWRRIGMGALVLAVAAVVVVPWSIRNARTFHEFVPVSNSLVQIVDGANCRLTYSGPFLGSWRSTFGNADARGAECFEGFNGSQPGLRRGAGRGGLPARRARLHPRRTSATCPKVGGRPLAADVRRCSGPRSRPSSRRSKAGRSAGSAPGRTCTGCSRRSRSAGSSSLIRRRATVWPLVAALVTVVVSTVITYGTQRFRITAEPAILVLAAAAIVAIARRVVSGAASAGRRRRRVVEAPRSAGFRATRRYAARPCSGWSARWSRPSPPTSILDGGSPSRATSTACCASMPEHLRLGVAGESIVLGSGAWLARRLGSRRSLARPDRRRGSTAASAPIRQYVRLLSSLVIFADEELAPEPPRRRGRRRDHARHRGPHHRLRRRRRGHRGHARPGRALGHGRRGRPVGRPRRGRAVLARRDGAEVPPPGRVRRARHARASRTPRAAASAAAPRSTAACTTASRPSSPTSGARRTASPSSRPRCSTGTPTGSRASSSVSHLPGAPPPSSAVLERGAAKLGWRAVEFARVFSYDSAGRGVKQTMARTFLPARDRRRRADHRRLPGRPTADRKDDRIVGARCRRTLPGRRDRVADDPGRPRLRVRRRDPDPDAAPAQRHPGADRQRAEVPPDDQGRGPLPAGATTTTTSRCTGSPSSRRSSRSAARPAAAATSRSRSPTPRATTRDALAQLGGRRRLLRRDPQRRQRPGHRAPGPARARS